jgi:CubicO group peptidase (beta-lactamase class C family)
MFDYFPDYETFRTAEKEKVTIEFLLSMTSGIEWNEGDVPLTNPDNDLARLIRSSDPIGFILQKPIVTEPGTTYYYKGGDTNLLGEIVKRATGLNADRFSRERLFSKLGITDYYWTYFPLAPDVVYVSGDLYLRPRDMAKFGLLFLDEGVWQGERIISKEWVKQSTREYISLRGTINGATAYGYQWWINDYMINNQTVHSYSARGWGGQEIIIFPQLNAVVVFTGGNYDTYVPVDEIIINYILPALI